MLKHSQRSQLNLIGRLLTSDLRFVTEGIRPGAASLVSDQIPVNFSAPV